MKSVHLQEPRSRERGLSDPILHEEAATQVQIVVSEPEEMPPQKKSLFLAILLKLKPIVIEDHYEYEYF